MQHNAEVGLFTRPSFRTLFVIAYSYDGLYKPYCDGIAKAIYGARFHAYKSNNTVTIIFYALFGVRKPLASSNFP